MGLLKNKRKDTIKVGVLTNIFIKLKEFLLQIFKFNKQKREKITKAYTAIKVATIILICLTIFFVKNIVEKERVSAESFLEQSVLQTASNLRGRITASINALNILAGQMAAKANFEDENDVTHFLASHISDYNYHILAFTYSDGRTVRYQKDVGRLPSTDRSKDRRLTSILSGDAVFTETKKNKETGGSYVNEYQVPVHNKKGKIIGMLGAQIYADSYLKVLSFNNYNKQGYSYIINEAGDFLIKPSRDRSKDENFFNRKDIQFIGKTKEEALGFFIEEDYGTLLFKDNGKTHVACFAIIDTTHRYVITVVPLSVLMLHINSLLFGIVLIVITISVMSFFLLYYNNKLVKHHEKAIYNAAFVDKLTKGNNRSRFVLGAKELLSKNTDKKYALIYVEITKFRALNEFYGVEDANKILADFYNLIQNNLTEDSIVARDHAATFVILYQYEREEFISKYFVDKILDEVEIYNNSMYATSKASGITLPAKLSLAFGVYLINDRDESIEQMYERAHIARRTINNKVNNACKFYDDNLRAKLLQEKSIEDEMVFALSDNQFCMYLQPKFNLQTRELAGAEALVRWIHPTKGLIPPINFIPLFEKNGFVKEVDKYIWRKACQFLAERKENNSKLFPISVNVSRVHMDDDKFIDEIILLTRKYGIDPMYLELELTESASFDNEERFQESVVMLKDLGFTVSMDDFGTGYSSLNMLRNLPIDILKLDRGFIKDTIQDVKGQIVTSSIIEMANKLNIVTVAEGIETEEQSNFLRSIGCKIAQGFLYGKPVDTETFKEMFIGKKI